MKLNDRVPKVTTNLAATLDIGDQSLTGFPVLINHNMGNPSLIMSLSLGKFVDMSEVPNKKLTEEVVQYQDEPVAQRNLHVPHATGLANYMLRGLIKAYADLNYSGKPMPESLIELIEKVGDPAYVSLQPFTCNIRSCASKGSDLQITNQGGKLEAYLSSKHILWVIDGQHRRHAAQMILDFLKSVRLNHKYPQRPKLVDIGRMNLEPEEVLIWDGIYELAKTKATISVEIHLGLDETQERQLFHDLNNRTKKVESGLAFSFDSSNSVNQFIKNELIDCGLMNPRVVDRDQKDWAKDEGVITRKDLIGVNALLFLNKTNISGAKPSDVDPKKAYAVSFWKIVNNLPHFGEEGAKTKTILAQSVALKALAKLSFDFGFNRSTKDDEALKKLFMQLKSIDFTHQNELWDYYNIDIDKRDKKFPGLKDYLPVSDGNRDMGSKVGEYMRFGAKHNDIFPLIGDMIRWELQLPKRKHKVTTSSISKIVKIA
jgi:hypothetical protein